MIWDEQAKFGVERTFLRGFPWAFLLGPGMNEKKWPSAPARHAEMGCRQTQTDAYHGSTTRGCCNGETGHRHAINGCGGVFFVLATYRTAVRATGSSSSPKKLSTTSVACNIGSSHTRYLVLYWPPWTLVEERVTYVDSQFFFVLGPS